MLNSFQHPFCSLKASAFVETWTLKQIQGDEVSNFIFPLKQT